MDLALTVLHRGPVLAMATVSQQLPFVMLFLFLFHGIQKQHIPPVEEGGTAHKRELVEPEEGKVQGKRFTADGLAAPPLSVAGAVGTVVSPHHHCGSQQRDSEDKQGPQEALLGGGIP